MDVASKKKRLIPILSKQGQNLGPRVRWVVDLRAAPQSLHLPSLKTIFYPHKSHGCIIVQNDVFLVFGVNWSYAGAL